MSARSFDIASGNETKKRTQQGSGYNRNRVDINMKGKGIIRDIAASAVQAVLPKIISSIGSWGSDKLAKKIKGHGQRKKKCGGSYRLY